MVDVVTRTHRGVVAHFRPDPGIGLALVPRGGILDPANDLTLPSTATIAGRAVPATSSLLHVEWAEFVGWLHSLGYMLTEDDDETPVLEEGLSFDGEVYAVTALDASDLPGSFGQIVEVTDCLRAHVSTGAA